METICKPASGFSPGVESAGTLILEYPLPRNKCLLFKIPCLWYVVSAIRADYNYNYKWIISMYQLIDQMILSDFQVHVLSHHNLPLYRWSLDNI